MYSRARLIALASIIKIVVSLGRRADEILFLITAEAKTIFWSFKPFV
jgi:hypothetical protein